MVLAVSLVCAGACGGDGSKAADVKGGETADAVIDMNEEDVSETSETPETAEPVDATELTDFVDLDSDATEDRETDTEDTAQPSPPLPVKPPFAKPADPLAGQAVESCPVYQEEVCVEGELRRCEVYDVAGATWEEFPDPLLRRAFLFDRWRDLYNSPDGQAIDRDFLGTLLPGTPESEWGSPERFAGYFGTGDGGIWTGWSTVASILRYVKTGTRADYFRMEQHVRDLVTMYDVTGVPGYLCRYHFLLLPEGAPNHPEHILRWEDNFHPNHHIRPIPNPETIENLPAIYTEGITDAEGTVWKGTPMWHGRPSIDQNTGPMTALPMAYALLEDEALKAKIVHHLTCYLKRLQRIEIRNLQSNTELIDGLIGYFSVGDLQFDPDDIDLTLLDTIVGYVQRQVNSKNQATFDDSCPATVQMEPWRVIDATSDMLLMDALNLVSDMDTTAERPDTLDHYYWPSLRGGDAMHLMHLAAMAYYLTGDEMYREFLFHELVGNIDTIGVAHTTGAFDLPKFCKEYYGDQITFGPWWAFLQLLDDCDLKTTLMQAYHTEFHEKLVRDVGNVDFNIMYAGAVDPAIATGREEALAYAMQQLPWMGGNGGLHMGSPDDVTWLDEPRRTYTTTPDGILAWTPDGLTAQCPQPHEVNICTAEVSVMGINLGVLTGWRTHDCVGSPYECEIAPGKCVRAMASGPLPVHLRNHTDYLWQRNPFTLGTGTWPGGEGYRQFAGSDYSVPYWNARRYGFVEEGEGQVLAWKPVGTCGNVSGD